MTNYRHDDYAIRDRIRARLAKDRPVVTPMNYCFDCGTDWDSRQFAQCPVCDCRKAVRELNRRLPRVRD